MTALPQGVLPGDYICVDIKIPFFKAPWTWIANWAIKKFTKSDYSHAFIVIDRVGTIVEAKPRGASYGNISEYSGMRMQTSTTVLTDEQRADIINAAKSFIGTPYGFMDIVYLGLYTQGVNWTWLLNKVRRLKNMICSELVAQSGDNAGVLAWRCGKPYAQEVTPGNLDELAQHEPITHRPGETQS